MLLSAAAVGFSRLLAPASGSLERTLPPILVTSWYLLLAVGSAVCLIGIAWRKPIFGLLIERAGLFFLCSAGLLYSIVLVAAGGAKAIAAASFVLGFGLASGFRAWDIGRILVQVRALSLAREAVLKEGGSKA